MKKTFFSTLILLLASLAVISFAWHYFETKNKTSPWFAVIDGTSLITKTNLYPKPILYGLRNINNSENLGSLLQIEVNNPSLLKQYLFPFQIQRGSLDRINLMYNNIWNNILVAFIQGSQLHEQRLNLFNLSMDLNTLEPFIHIDKELLSNMKVVSGPLTLLLDYQLMGIALGGSVNNQGAVNLIFIKLDEKGLNVQGNVICHSNAKGNFTLLHLDEKKTTHTNHLYATNETGEIWKFDFSNHKDCQCTKITSDN